MSNTQDSNRPEPELQIDVLVDDAVTVAVDQEGLRLAATLAAQHRGFDRGQIGVRVTTDDEIHKTNRQFLKHDYPTDVISFPYECRPPAIEGELVVSADTAARRASELGWPVDSELALYVVHGTLHIAGMDDLNPDDRQAMRESEQVVMTQLGIDDITRFGADVDRPPIQDHVGENASDLVERSDDKRDVGIQNDSRSARDVGGVQDVGGVEDGEPA